ncbi:MAG: peptidoglycan DD-metalloendopeptidase family protein [Gammaproteobacteria bacterium]|nr:MAG: peptidoglycan DD-metalloendopeptidase family protein [Gammaproteobacteria bacterium]
MLGGGYLLGISFGHKTLLNEWKADVSAQKERLQIAKRESETHVDALTTKVGLIQAHVNRIDALGNMLVTMAGLEADEFSFDSVPGLGGPNASGDGEAHVDMEIDAVLARLNTEIDNREYQLRVLNDLLIDEKLEQETRPQGRPVIHGWISSYFGKRTSPFSGKTETHRGVDFAGKAGNDVVAVAGGVITHASKKGAYGYLVEIDHGNGYVTRYGHNQMVHVQVGEAIKRGQVIAKLGSTGRSTGPHVHFEVIKDGARIDPMKFIE